jgi:hypothetical protein
VSGFFKTLSVVFAFVVAGAAAGCNSSSDSGTTSPPACSGASYVTQLYPVSGTNSVPANLHVMVFSANSAAAAPIVLAPAGQNVSDGYTNTTAHSVPSPLPSPAATAKPGQTLLFAVSLPLLKPHEKYATWALESDPCVIPFAGNYVQVGEFSTL